MFLGEQYENLEQNDNSLYGRIDTNERDIEALRVDDDAIRGRLDTNEQKIDE